MSYITDSALDAALSYIDTNAAVLHICSAEPANYAGVAAVTLGIKTPPAISTPADRALGGREITVSAISDGEVTGTGTATHYAIVSASALLVTGALNASQAVTDGNTFTLTSFTIGIPDAA